MSAGIYRVLGLLPGKRGRARRGVAKPPRRMRGLGSAAQRQHWSLTFSPQRDYESVDAERAGPTENRRRGAWKGKLGPNDEGPPTLCLRSSLKINSEGTRELSTAAEQENERIWPGF